MKKICLLVVMLCGLMFLSMSTVSAADWGWVYSNEGGTVYVDNNSIRRDSNKSGYVFYAFIKDVYSEAGKKVIIEDMRKQGIAGIQNISFTLKLEYFKLDNGIKYHATLSGIFYDSKGNPIKEIKNGKLNWQTITPDTYNETLFDNVRARVPN